MDKIFEPMDLKALCTLNMVDQIKKLPPQLQEECVGTSIEAMKETARKDAEKTVIQEVKRSADVVIDDITKLLIEAHRTGGTYQRPEYTKDMDDELYYVFVGVAERFVQNYGHKLTPEPRPWSPDHSDSDELADYDHEY